ncbi:putative siderophore transport system permease protein YfhA [Bacillus rhizoplanae]|uniref:Siderophore transport system permease protein YfhA n=1 Tax=Bacillus rhizoplanae TaxID=2880966 RepID=A0ABM8Y839_9BACI|nr:iron ABC transporter permease [Bacillus rhizoplanae]CAG9611902.1 putative siderophore transport system permease protein YfhA [Bacillus rhizoplanae]
MKKFGRFTIVMIVGLILLIAVALLSLRLGAVPTPIADIIEGMMTGQGVVVKYRLPRLVIAILVGINMALSGAILQSVTRNPLAAPDIIGISAGGGLAAVIMLLMFPNVPPIMLPIAAFVGAMLASLLVYALSYQKGGVKPERLALCGVAISAGLHALITFIIVKFALDSSQALVWLKGSLYARSWQHVEMLWPWTLIGAVITFMSYKQINLLLLNEETVKGLGMRIDVVRLVLIGVAVALAASSVAVAGTIGFVGLVIPHAARLLVGSDSRLFLPVSALLGALLVTGADMVGRIIIPPIEIPAGIITALIGAPYFIYLLVIRKTT